MLVAVRKSENAHNRHAGAALANAVFNQINKRVCVLPVMPDRLLRNLLLN